MAPIRKFTAAFYKRFMEMHGKVEGVIDFNCFSTKTLVITITNRKKTASDLATELAEQINKPISAHTTRRRLQEAGLKGCKARKKPWLSDNNRKARYEWALKYRSFTESDWSNIVWSDESNFEIFGTAGVTFVRRRVGEEFYSECVVPTVKHGRVSVMLWGCMSDTGVGEKFVCEGRMDSTKYINVLDDLHN